MVEDEYEAMTQEEWLVTTQPYRLLCQEFLNKASSRKRRLFACACVRHIWHLLPSDSCRSAVDVAERFADGLATRRELSDADDVLERSNKPDSNDVVHLSAHIAVALLTGIPIDSNHHW